MPNFTGKNNMSFAELLLFNLLIVQVDCPQILIENLKLIKKNASKDSRGDERAKVESRVTLADCA